MITPASQQGIMFEDVPGRLDRPVFTTSNSRKSIFSKPLGMTRRLSSKSPAAVGGRHHQRRARSRSPTRKSLVKVLLGKVIHIESDPDRTFCSSSITVPDFDELKAFGEEFDDDDDDIKRFGNDREEEEEFERACVAAALAPLPPTTLRRAESTDNRPSLPRRRPSGASTVTASSVAAPWERKPSTNATILTKARFSSGDLTAPDSLASCNRSPRIPLRRNSSFSCKSTSMKG